MIIAYGENKILKERKSEAEKVLKSIPYRYCFITGSFLFKEKYKDIDVFVITRSKKIAKLANKKIKIQKMDFNDLYSLFYHASSKCCLAKNILPEKPLKVTISDFWDVINEAVPSIFNEKNKFKKDIRSLVLYTEYFKKKKVLDSLELKERVDKFKHYKEVLRYIEIEAPRIVNNELSKGYIKRFFYTQTGFYKDLLKYEGHRFLYSTAHLIIGAQNG